MSIAETINRIATKAKMLEDYLRWHPNPEPPPKCVFCGKEFFDTRHVVAEDDGESTRQVVIQAVTRLQLHVYAYTYGGHAGMCAWTVSDRARYRAAVDNGDGDTAAMATLADERAIERAKA